MHRPAVSDIDPRRQVHDPLRSRLGNDGAEEASERFWIGIATEHRFQPPHRKAEELCLQSS